MIQFFDNKASKCCLQKAKINRQLDYSSSQRPVDLMLYINLKNTFLLESIFCQT